MLLYRIIKRVSSKLAQMGSRFHTWCIFKGYGVDHLSYRTNGTPFVMIARGGKMSIGKNFVMNNGVKGNPIGCYSKCTFFVDKGYTIKIGDNVGISQTALVALHNITIGNNVKIGGGVCVYTSDFHSLDPAIRRNPQTDMSQKQRKEVVIKDDAFIGAFSIILKGVTIGANSIIGAGSVVTKSVPDNEIWAGNPARFIKKI